MPFWLRLETKQPRGAEAALLAAMMPTLEDWLGENVETEEYRNRVRSVALGLGDLCACELEDLRGGAARFHSSKRWTEAVVGEFGAGGEEAEVEHALVECA